MRSIPDHVRVTRIDGLDTILKGGEATATPTESQVGRPMTHSQSKMAKSEEKGLQEAPESC